LTPGREYNFTVFSKNIISVLYSNGHFQFENKTFKLPRGKYATRIVRNVATERWAACNPPPPLPPTHTHICS
jgi:tRNA(Glu) U13 pseudouridine synthase TruD